MPELPELLIAARQLRAHCEGKVCLRATVHRDRSARAQGVTVFEANMKKRKFVGVRRHGKNLFVKLNDEGLLWIHFGMSGKFAFGKRNATPTKSTRVTFEFAKSKLFFEDARIFGGVAAGPRDEIYRIAKVSGLGKDALELRGGSAWHQALTRRRADLEIKVALMDQARVAGLGNIQAAEALFLAQLSPTLRVSELTLDDYKLISRSVRQTIKRTLDASTPEGDKKIEYMSDGAHVDNPFRVYGREGESCSRRKCGGTIERFVQAQRATFFCPECQS